MINLQNWKTAGLILLGVAGLVFQNTGLVGAVTNETAGAEVSITGLDAAKYLAENSNDVVAPRGFFRWGNGCWTMT